MIDSKHKILVVEDDAAVNQLLCRRLEREDYLVEGITSGAELLNLLKKGTNADLMLLDYNLIDFDAATVIDNMKAQNLDLPFIICTGVGSEMIAVNMMKEGARDYLVKDKAFLEVLTPTVKKTLSDLGLEKELALARKEIDYQNAILSAVYELSLDGVIVVDENGLIVSMNHRFHDLWQGVKFEEGMSSNDLFDTISSQLIDSSRFLTSIMNIAAIMNPVDRKHEDLKLKSGSFYELYSTPMKDSQNNSYGRIWYFRDVTLQRKAQKAIEKAKQDAESAARNKAEFLATFSHEIRTPMNSLSGFLELLSGSGLNDIQSEFLSSVKMSCDSLMKLINNTLDLSRLEAGSLQIESQLFDISQTVSEALVLSEANRRKNVELKMSIADGLPPVSGDSLRLQQVLINLLSNALKFTDEGTVTASCKCVGENRYLFEITDTGLGISAEKQAEIFEAFRQEKDSTARERGGTGLGLSISARIVRLMDGELKVDSEPGKGSRFYFEVTLNPLKVD